MPQTNDAPRERIARSLFEADIEGPDTYEEAASWYRALADAVTPIVAEEVRKAKAEALRETAPHLNDSGDERFLLDAANQIETGANHAADH